MACCAVLAGCSGGAAVVSIPPPVSSANSAPIIAGSPRTAVEAGEPYVFQPTAYDPDGHSLRFIASGLPSWARFDPATGRLSGTPAPSQSGAYTGITIGVTDGTVTIALPAFSITVAMPAEGAGTALLSWTTPVQNTDGSPLTDLVGYQIYSGRSPGSLARLTSITSPSITSHRVDGLTSGTHYFAVSAFSSTGVESALSGVASKTIP